MSLRCHQQYSPFDAFGHQFFYIDLTFLSTLPATQPDLRRILNYFPADRPRNPFVIATNVTILRLHHRRSCHEQSALLQR